MQFATRFKHFLIAIVIVALPLQGTLARTAGHKGMPRLQAETPKFDTSLGPFKLNIEHREYCRFLKDSTGMLQGHTGKVDLRAAAKKNMLTGRVTELQRQSTIVTREYGVRPRFYIDLQKLTATFAPDVAQAMEAQIAAARRKAAGEAALGEKQLAVALNSRRPQPGALSVPKQANVAPEVSKMLESEKSLAAQRAKQDSKAGGRQLAEAQTQAQQPWAKMPAFPKIQVVIPAYTSARAPGLPAQQVPKGITSTAEQQMREQLVRSGLSVPKSQTATELELATKRARTIVSRAQPVMDTILTHLHKIPDAHIPSASNTRPAAEDSTTSVVEWDKWHARFATLSRDPILKAISNAGNPSGSNTVEITVTANRKVTARITQPSNAAFDKAILQAYASLDGNPSLKYPAGSRRSTITFLIDNKHAGNGVPSGVNSQTSVGDREIVHRHQ